MDIGDRAEARGERLQVRVGFMGRPAEEGIRSYGHEGIYRAEILVTRFLSGNPCVRA